MRNTAKTLLCSYYDVLASNFDISYNESRFERVNTEKGGSDIATKKFRDLTASEKATRYAYAKERRQKLARAMREAGIIGQARSHMDPAEKKAHRKAYSKQYRKKITAEAKAYREMMKRG